MRVAILSESSADEAALRVLVNEVLGIETMTAHPPALRSRGWPSVKTILPSVIKHLHYHTDADGLVVVADSDDSVVHTAQHETAPTGDPACRLCQLRQVRDSTFRSLREVPGRERLKVAIGIAVPAVEAWYRCGLDARVSEATWMRPLLERRKFYTRPSLKQDVYGTDRPSIELETEKAVEAAKRLSDDLGSLEASFPAGFGALARDLRTWR